MLPMSSILIGPAALLLPGDALLLLHAPSALASAIAATIAGPDLLSPV
jgi:hypothetical protein